MKISVSQRKAGLGAAAALQGEAPLTLTAELPGSAFPARPPSPAVRLDTRSGPMRALSLVDLQLTCGLLCSPPGPASACTPALLHSSDLGPGISVQFSSVAQSCPALCDPMNRSMPGFPVQHHLPELTQTQVHRVSDAIQPSHPLLSPSPPASNPSQHQSLFQ